MQEFEEMPEGQISQARQSDKNEEGKAQEQTSMIHKKTLMAAIIIIAMATTRAQITLIDPPNGATIEKAAFENQAFEIQITIQNTGENTEQNIALETDANASFWPTGFGLESNTQKTVTATVWPKQGTTTFYVGEESFQLKTNIIENKDWAQKADEYIKNNITTIWLGSMIATFAILTIILRKTW